MTVPSRDSKGSSALETLVALGRESAEPPNRAELDDGLRRMRARLETARTRRRWLGRTLVVASLVAFPLTWAYGGLWMNSEQPALPYQVAGGSVLEGGYLQEVNHPGITVSFAEGTRVELSPGTRGRLRSVDAQGARIGIENGSASFEVTPGTGRRWEVEVGPFLVTVKGTAFDVSWDPAREQFELRLQRGQVLVSGPVSGGELTLVAGQRLFVNLPRRETLITSNRTPSAGDEPNPARPSSTLEPPTPEEETRGTQRDAAADADPEPDLLASPARATKLERRWSEALARGRWEQILREVEGTDLAGTLESASREDLFALASAARYGRRAELARQALVALRRRFPESRRALDATFLLGRVEESRGSGSGPALAWYDEYLSRAPAGAYAAEALGRKLTIVNAVSGPEQAEPIARDYLRRFPKGSYAGSARALLGER